MRKYLFNALKRYIAINLETMPDKKFQHLMRLAKALRE